METARANQALEEASRAWHAPRHALEETSLENEALAETAEALHVIVFIRCFQVKSREWEHWVPFGHAARMHTCTGYTFYL